MLQNRSGNVKLEINYKKLYLTIDLVEVGPNHDVCVFVLCRHKATELEKQLEEFTNQYLQPQQWAALHHFPQFGNCRVIQSFVCSSRSSSPKLHCSSYVDSNAEKMNRFSLSTEKKFIDILIINEMFIRQEYKTSASQRENLVLLRTSHVNYFFVLVVFHAK